MAIQERNLPVNPPAVAGPWDGELYCPHCNGRNFGRFSVSHAPSCPTQPHKNDGWFARMEASRAHEKAEKKAERDKLEQRKKIFGY